MISVASPLAGWLTITPNGYWGAPRPNRGGTHYGLDFATPKGAPVYSATDGTIENIGFDRPVAEGGGGGGNFVTVRTVDRDGTPYQFQYMHLERVTATQGQGVKQGTQIGTAGASGTTHEDAPHLHLQIRRVDTKTGDRPQINPAPLFEHLLAHNEGRAQKPAERRSVAAFAVPIAAGAGLLALALADVETSDGALGDLYCTAEEYTAAAKAVGALHGIMANAPPPVQARYKGEVNALLSTWNTYEKQRADSFLARLNPAFLCNFKTLGQQAEQIATRIAAESNQAAPSTNQQLQPGAADRLADTATQAIKAVGIGAGALLLFELFQTISSNSRQRQGA